MEMGPKELVIKQEIKKEDKVCFQLVIKQEIKEEDKVCFDQIIKQEIKEEDKVCFDQVIKQELIEDQSYSLECVKEESVLNEIEQVDSCVDLIGSKRCFVVDGIKEENEIKQEDLDDMEFQEEEINCEWSESTLNERDPLDLSEMKDTSMLLESAQSSSSYNTNGKTAMMVQEVKNSNGSVIYHFNDGYYYHVSSSDSSKAYMKCIKKASCSARASMPILPTSRSIENVRQGQPHNHHPDFLHLQVIELKEKLVKRSREEVTQFRTIFDEECARVPIEVSGQIFYASFHSTMYRARRQLRPNIPTTLVEFGELLSLPQHRRFSEAVGGGQYFREVLHGDEDAGVAVVFISPTLGNLLRTASELHMDGTFKVVPRYPSCHQLFTIMSFHFNHAFPVVSALMTKKNRAAYDMVLRYVITLEPALSPQTIYTDFESALQSAARAAFPNSQMFGCWFHSANAMCRNARRLGLLRLMEANESVKQVIKMAMTLPLLPAAQIMDGFRSIAQFAIDEGVEQSTEQFLNYVQRTWLDGVGVLSLTVFGQRRRTNNYQEAYHRTLKQKMRQIHPDIWIFTDGLRTQENSYCQRYRSLCNGHISARPQNRQYVAMDKRIQAGIKALLAGSCNVLEFLLSSSHALNDVKNEAANIVDDDDLSDDDVEGPPPPLGPLLTNVAEDEDPVPRHGGRGVPAVRRMRGARPARRVQAACRARAGRGARSAPGARAACRARAGRGGRVAHGV